ncbi:MAG: NAD(P)H-dependent oxidoreductase [Desulfovibrio sp.]|nr:NAD(P)H-dependent oxidoreductase [Desulfovibrio sp.]MCA1986994.1 NAD(P)H-dependent oxidoreductase [Desulfovibrio sp.]
MENAVVGYACSPRPKGNSDAALALLLAECAAVGVPAERLSLRSACVLPCLGCQRCALPPGGLCVQSPKDQSAQLFAPLLTAPAVCFAAPIYFYHLPSGFKAFIDRAQSFYARRERGDAVMRALPPRKAYVVLVAGRTRGERLFEGALLTLKYFLEPFNITLADPCLLRGVDQPGDLARLAIDEVTAYARAAAAAMRALSP